MSEDAELSIKKCANTNMYMNAQTYIHMYICTNIHALIILVGGDLSRGATKTNDCPINKLCMDLVLCVNIPFSHY